MQEFVVEQSLGEQLGGLAGQVILCDSTGRVLGFFSPLPEHPRVEDLRLGPTLTVAETQELRKVQTGKSLSEILARLGIQ